MLRILDRIYLGAASAGSGGGSVDESRIIVKSATIPTAGENYLGSVYMYVGETNSTYTHGYIYECKENVSYDGLIGFDPAKIAFDYTQGNLIEFLESLTPDFSQVAEGSFTYDIAGDIWSINGIDGEGNTIFSNYRLYTQDLRDAGFVFINPSEDYADGEVIGYYLTLTPTSSYAWERIDVQPGATRGRFLALWNCATGLAESNPPSSPYPYGAGDYYIVGTVGTTNYKPSGSSYVIGTASTTVETNDVAVNDTYYYDGNNWNLQKNTATEYVAGTGISINNKTISVASPTLTNTSTGSGSLTISGTSASDASATNIGVSSSASGSFGSSFGWGSSASGNYSTAVGSQSTAYFYSAAFGYGSTASSQNTTAIGPASTASAYDAIALGHNASATKESAIQIGNGTNSEDKTMYVGALINNINHNYKLLDLTTGKIPADRLPSTAPSIDNTTITENASNQLQASAVMNVRTGTDAMPIWQGTEQEWTNGVSTDWYNWRTDVVFTSSNKTLPVTGAWTGVAYGNGIYVAVNSGTSSDTDVYAYSYDGETWIQGQMPSVRGWYGVAFNNGIFVAYTWDRYNSLTNIIATSTDGLNWTERTVYSSRWNNIIVVNNKFFLLSSTQSMDYLTSDDGINWVHHTKPGNNSSLTNIAYGNGVYVFVGNASFCYTSTDLGTWESHNPGSSGAWYNNVFGSGNFVITDGWWNFDTSRCLVSTDGVSWTSITLPLTGAWHKLYYLDNLFILLGYNNNKFLYSSDGINWSSADLPTASRWGGACFGNKYIFTANANNIASNVIKQQGTVYTAEATPTTTSTVYSEPNTSSALTITSIGTGTITLSDNNTYTYTSSGDVTTYQTIGDAYPNYLANINGVGVKIGNTLIADNTDTSALQTKSNLVTSVSSSSTDTQYPSAKLLYDTVGNIEATLDAIIAQGSNS